MKKKICLPQKNNGNSATNTKINFYPFSKIIVFTFISFVFFTISCSKDEDTTKVIAPTPVSNYRILSDYGFTYEYTTSGKLAKKAYKSRPLEYIEYTYDSQGRLTNIDDKTNPNSYVFNYTNFIYDAQGKITTMLLDFKRNSLPNPEKAKYELTYNTDNNLSRKDYYTWDGVTNVFNPSTSYTLFKYDGSKRLIKSELYVNNLLDDYDEFGYDTKGNVNDVKTYRKKNNSTEFYFNKRFQYVYNDKKNPEYNLYPNVIYSEYPWNNSPNFSIDEISSYFNEAGLTSSNTYTLPVYQYNDGGYPTRVVGSNEDVYTYQKY
jgi:YD repeat-containing protein